MTFGAQGFHFSQHHRFIILYWSELTDPCWREVKGFPFLSQSMDGCGLPSAGHLNSTLVPAGCANTSRSVMRRPQRGGPSAIRKWCESCTERHQHPKKGSMPCSKTNSKMNGVHSLGFSRHQRASGLHSGGESDSNLPHCHDRGQINVADKSLKSLMMDGIPWMMVYSRL